MDGQRCTRRPSIDSGKGKRNRENADSAATTTTVRVSSARSPTLQQFGVSKRCPPSSIPKQRDRHGRAAGDPRALPRVAAEHARARLLLPRLLFCAQFEMHSLLAATTIPSPSSFPPSSFPPAVNLLPVGSRSFLPSNAADNHTCSCHGTQLLPYIRRVTVLPGQNFQNSQMRVSISPKFCQILPN